MNHHIGRPKRKTTDNSTYKKLAVQWLSEHSTSYQLLCWVDSFVLDRTNDTESEPFYKSRKIIFWTTQT